MNSALTRYRVMAYVVGVFLLLLVLVAMPLKYLEKTRARSRSSAPSTASCTWCICWPRWIWP